MDNKLLSGRSKQSLPDALKRLRMLAEATNKIWAGHLKINQAAAVSCIKPEGTSSQLTNSASGIHARHSDYYIRTVRADVKDPITLFMMDQGIPHEPDVMSPDTTTVFSFPIKSPKGSVTRDDMSAIEQLELWLTYQRHFTDHKPSVTITVADHEWPSVGGWVYDHFDEMSGVSFLPKDEHTYQQAPYQDVDKATYEAALAKMPKHIDWDLLADYEQGDTTKGSQTLSCTGSVCEIVDVEAA